MSERNHHVHNLRNICTHWDVPDVYRRISVTESIFYLLCRPIQWYCSYWLNNIRRRCDVINVLQLIRQRMSSYAIKGKTRKHNAIIIGNEWRIGATWRLWVTWNDKRLWYRLGTVIARCTCYIRGTIIVWAIVLWHTCALTLRTKWWVCIHKRLERAVWQGRHIQRGVKREKRRGRSCRESANRVCVGWKR